MSETIRNAGTSARHLGNGFVRTVDGAAWLYAQLPAQPPVRDAANWTDRERNAQALLTLLPRIAELTPHIPFAGRKAMKGFYREIHILAVSTPEPFVPSGKLDMASRIRLQREYDNTAVHDRFTLIGVRLATGGGKERRNVWRRMLGALNTITSLDALGIVEDSAFDHDRDTIAQLFQDAGCTIPSNAMMRRALAWWRTDRKPEIVPVMVEHEHMHTFPDYESCRRAARFFDLGGDCRTWRDHNPYSYPMTIVSLGALPFEGQDEREVQDSDWAASLLAQGRGGGQGALCLSVRGLLEPGDMSREQIDKDKENVYDKAMQQAMDGHKRNVRVAGELAAVNDVYQTGERPWPTLIDARVHAAIPQIIDRPTQVLYPGEVSLNPDRQEAAFQDMMIGSPVAFNPSPVYWPVPILAYAGLAGRSVAGDDMGRGAASDLPGALLGFTEADLQPVYVSPFESREKHDPPCLLVTGATGSGKTRVLLHIAAQLAQLPDPYTTKDGVQHPRMVPYAPHVAEDRPHIPIVFLDPKPNSDDFTGFVRKRHGTIVRLDSEDANGILDPLRCIPDRMRTDRVQTAVEMLSQITGGKHGDRARELALTTIVSYGTAHGADCLGEAVDMAYEAYMARGADAEHIDPLVEQITPVLRRVVRSDPMFQLIYGTRHGGRSLAISQGLTLLSAGTLNIISDKTGSSAVSDIQRWVVRMAALGATAAIMGRNGVLIVDEAWSLLGDEFGVGLVTRMGRLARAQHYLPVFASQKVDEFVDAGLEDFVGRGLALGMGVRNEGGSTGESQAQAVCRLFNQPEDGRLHERMMHARVLDTESEAPDWQSLYALFDPADGRLLRGTICYYMGVDGSAIPVEVRISRDLV